MYTKMCFFYFNIWWWGRGASACKQPAPTMGAPHSPSLVQSDQNDCA